jgi:MoaA/NifB/PqqE/SkfB family radical SAM enzyme
MWKGIVMDQVKYDTILLGPQISSCGQSCKHCWVTNNLENHKPFEEVKEVIDGMAKTLEEPAITDLALLYFLDEITLYPQLTEMLSYCRERNVLPQQVLVSNGSGIAIRSNWVEILSGLKECGVIAFLITLFGEEEYHDWFTGIEGSFRRTMKAVERLKTNGLKVSWNMFLTNENVDQIVSVARRLEGRIGIFTPTVSNRWREWSDIHADIDVFSRIPEDIQKYVLGEYRSEAEWIKLILKHDPDTLERSSYKEARKRRYKSLTELDGILLRGDVYPSYEVGSMKADSLREIFLSEKTPPGYVPMNEMNLLLMAQRYGDPDCTTAYTLDTLKSKWYSDSEEEIEDKQASNH